MPGALALDSQKTREQVAHVESVRQADMPSAITPCIPLLNHILFLYDLLCPILQRTMHVFLLSRACIWARQHLVPVLPPAVQIRWAQGTAVLVVTVMVRAFMSKYFCAFLGP